MKRLVWMVTASFITLVPAAAGAGGYFTWYNQDEVERGPVLVDEPVNFRVPIVDEVAQLPAGYFVTNNSWSMTDPESSAGACDVPLASDSGTSMTTSFPAAGSYEICLEMFPYAGGESLWDKQTITVDPAPNNPPTIQYLDVYPNPAVVGSDLTLVYAQIYDEDGVASCEVDFGDGNGFVEATIAQSEWDPSAASCTGPTYAYATPGDYQLTVRATDDLGASGTSEPRSVTVFARPYVFVEKIRIDSTLARSRRLFDYTGTVDLVGVGSAASLAKAQVTAEWRDGQTGRVLLRASTTANADGVAKFVMRSVAAYEYNLCVTNVRKSGFDYYVDPERNPPCAFGGEPK